MTNLEKPVEEHFTKVHLYHLVCYALIKFRLVPSDCQSQLFTYTTTMGLISPKIGKGATRIPFFSKAQTLKNRSQEIELFKEIAKQFELDESLLSPGICVPTFYTGKFSDCRHG